MEFPPETESTVSSIQLANISGASEASEASETSETITSSKNMTLSETQNSQLKKHSDLDQGSDQYLKPNGDIVTFNNCYNDWDRKEQRIIIGCYALVAFIAPLTTTIVLPALTIIQKEFNSSSTETVAILTVYIFTFAFMPLIWGPISDNAGRRKIVIAALVCYIIAGIGCGLSTSLEMLLFFRALQGFGSSAGIPVGGAVIGEVFPPPERGRAIGLYAAGPTIAPTIAPVMGGLLTLFFGWRSVFFVSAGFAVVALFFAIFFVPETHPQHRQIAKGRMSLLSNEKATIKSVLTTVFISSFQKSIKQWISYPAIRGVAFCGGSHFASMYVCLSLYPFYLEIYYGLNAAEIGIAYIPFGIATIFAIAAGGVLSDKLANFEKYENSKSLIAKLSLWANKKGGRYFARNIIPASTLGLMLLVVPTFWIFIYFTLHLSLILIIAFLIGFALTFGRSSLMAYIYQITPQSASTSISILYSVQFFFSAVAIQIITPLSEITGILLVGVFASSWLPFAFYYYYKTNLKPEILSTKQESIRFSEESSEKTLSQPSI